ncbi:plastocyanin [Flavobacterium arsenatis]|uniref:Plastocyanin n=1 Tax=Flavobacterium arsenatis TaxID=1484332 RepID=A0ABU1TQ50_9FLAO|nr:GEVED domain-containing protein [Flavobacterium arsenatis]MDR6968036.1 plastocyanin [Flavobacterium arsenatis]
MKNFIFYCSNRYGLEFTKKWLSLLVVFGFYLSSHTVTAQCVPAFPDGCADGDVINSLTIASLGYSHSNTGCSAGAYGDFTESETFPDLQAGEIYTFVTTHAYQTQFVRVWIDFDEDNVFGNTADTELVGLAASTGTGSGTTTTIQVSIPSTAPLGTFRLRIANRYNNQPLPCNVAGFGEAHDYMVTILEANPCVAPTSLAVSGTTYSSTTLGWESDGTSFDVEWGESGFTIGEGTLLTGVANQYLLGGLNENTSYQYYVRNNCGAGGVSSWVGPYSFFTGYCVPPASSFTGYIINGVTTLGGYTNITNPTGATASTASYGDFTNLAVTQSPGGEFTYGVTVPGYTNVEIWADLNKDLVFGADELIGAHVYGTSTTTFTGTIVLPADLELGDYRVRVRSRYYFQTVASSCGAASYGETEDYTLSVVAPPACLPPSALMAENVTFESAELSWESEGTLFDIEWGEAPLTAGEGTLLTGVANQYALGGLNAETNYQYFVRQDCGVSGESLWAGPYSFFTGYCTVSTEFTGDYTSSFSTNGAVSNVSYTATSNPSGSYTNQTANIIEQAQGLSFNFSTTYVGGGQRVNIWVDWDQDMTFDNTTGSTEKVYSQYVTGATQSGTIMIPLDVPVGDYRMRIRSQWGSAANPAPCGHVSYGTTIDYTLHVLEAPTCFPPTALTAGNLTYESAELSWESDGTLFDIEWGEAPLAEGEGTVVSGVTNQYVLGGLNENTSYQYYVRQDCGANDQSFWAGPYSFFTGYCVPPASSFSGYIINSVSTSGGYTNISNTTGSTASTASYGDFTALSVSQSPGGEFTYSVTVPGYTNIEIWADYNNDLLFGADELIGNHVYGTSATTFTGTVILPADLELGDYRVRVRSRYYSNAASACGAASYGETEDYTLTIMAPPACLPPTALMAENVTFESAELSWESDGTLFDIEWGEAPFAPGEGTLVSGVANQYTLGSLNAETNYQYYVRQDCGVSGQSLWAGPYSFFTGYCGVSVLYTGDYTSSFSTSGAVSNVSYTATANPSGSYTNQTANIIEQAQGLSFNFSTTYVGGGQRVNIWVDWDQDMIFDNTTGSTEKIYSQYVTGATQTGTIMIPADMPLGDYRMRIRSQWGDTANPAPCGEVNYGTTIDYTLHVLPAPSCLPPTALMVENVTFESAELLWESDGTLFDIEWGEAPFAAGEGTLVSGVANQYLLGGLSEITTYQYYVRQDCGDADGVSFWSGPFSFTTPCSPKIPDYDQDFATFVPECWSRAGAGTTAPQGAGAGIWVADGFLNVGSTGAIKVNLYDLNRIGWMISPLFDLSAGNYQVSFDYGVTTWNETTTSTMGSDDRVELFMSEDNGETWTVVTTFNAASGVSNTLQTFTEPIASTSATVKFALFATDGTVNDTQDYDFFIDNFGISTDLAVKDFGTANFKLYPNPVKDILNLTNTQNISNVEVFNMLGQQVIAKSINATQGQIDMSHLATGTYLVRVASENQVKTIKVIKQ